MSVFFHSSFGLNRKFMAGVLNASINYPTKSPKEVAIPFGYDAPFTSRYKSWLQKCGIAKLQSGSISLTPHGEIIWLKDPNLNNIVTQWYIHWELSKSADNAESWYFFYNEFLPKHKKFSKNDLMQALAMRLMPHSAKHFGPESSMTKIITRKLLDCYIKPEALGAINIIKMESNKSFLRANMEKQGPWPDIHTFKKQY